MSKQDIGEKETRNVIFIGDSLLDDFLYLDDKHSDLTKEMSDLGFKVDNYAVDGCKLRDLTLGIEPSEGCQSARSYKYPVNKDGKVYQMELLSKKSSVPFQSVYGSGFETFKSSVNSDMVVISVGGNDLRVDMMKILFGIEPFFNGVVSKQYIDDYENIIEKAKDEGRKVVLVSMYLPYLGVGSTYGMFGPLAVAVVERWKEFIIPLAEKHNVSVLDLSLTFDNNNRKNYGTTELQPSNLTNKCIARCLDYIYSNYNGFGIYFAPNCDIGNIQLSKLNHKSQ